MLLSAPSGDVHLIEIASAREVGGPHEVGGAEPGAERR
jgi:hypothetical protein